MSLEKLFLLNIFFKLCNVWKYLLDLNYCLFSFLKQKIEVLDEDEEDDDDYNGDLVSSDIEQIQNLLEFKVK